MKVSVGDMLLTLTGNLSDVRSRLQALEDQKLLAELEGLATTVGGLNEKLAAIVAAVVQMQAEPEPEPEPAWPGFSPNWTDDLDQDQARELWDWLTEWCQNILWPIYARDVWKPCWYLHTQVRIELTALRGTWKHAYLSPDVPPTRAMEWHSRWWPHAEKMLKEELKNCGHPREGLPRPKHPVPVPQQPTDENPYPEPPAFHIGDFADPDFLRWVEDNISKRREPEKEPSE